MPATPTLRNLAVTCLAASLFAYPALANNTRVENALKSREDLSDFYQALVTTGVINELKPNRNYTIFAPTNDALRRISPEQYPCFYSAECTNEIADVLRNHIVPGETYLDDVVHQKGGVYSIDRRLIRIGETNMNSYSVDGISVKTTNWFVGGLLYRIDGVVANQIELDRFRMLKTPMAIGEEQVTTTTNQGNAPCNADLPGCPPDNSKSVTTIKSRTYVAPVMTTP